MLPQKPSPPPKLCHEQVGHIQHHGKGDMDHAVLVTPGRLGRSCNAWGDLKQVVAQAFGSFVKIFSPNHCS